MHHFLKDSQGIRDNEDHRAEMEDAVGDILIFLFSFCSQEGILVSEALADTWSKVSKRDWVKYPENGVQA